MNNLDLQKQYNDFKNEVYKTIEETGSYNGKTKEQMERFFELALHALNKNLQ